MDRRKTSSKGHRDKRREQDKVDKLPIENAEMDALEKKVEDLTRQLAEEKQTSRRSVAKLQREIARLKSERSHAQRGESREGLMKDLERERMLRVDAEQRLMEMRAESDSCRSRLHALQDEFNKMEEMVRSMLQYKTKIDQLKQEKSNLAVTYETNLQKYSSHISNLERENMVLLNEVKKLESQLSGKGDDHDKSKLLLQRLKMLEAENSALVLENEQQRHQYEKCLDEIANQVVQALLAQKSLREECMKLQGRVQDLELQNRQLNIMFQKRLRCASDSLLQSLPSRKLAPVVPVQGHPPVSITAIVHPHTHVQSQTSTHTTVVQASSGPATAKGETTPPVHDGSSSSLQSMCSDYMLDDSLGKPEMSSPPPWLRDKMDLNLTDESRQSSSDNSPVTPPTPSHDTIVKASSSPALPAKIETEFPVNNSSPKAKRVGELSRGSQSLDRIAVAKKSSNLKNPARRKPKSLCKKSSSVKNVNAESSTKNPTLTPPPASSGASSKNPPVSKPKSRIPSRLPTPSSIQGPRKVSADTPEQKKQGPKHNTPQSFHDLMSQRKKALSQESSPKKSGSPPQPTVDPTRHTLPFRSQYYYDYSDEDSDSRPVSRDSSTASTVSLNDLLDSSLDADHPLEEDFLSDWSSNCLSPNSLNSTVAGQATRIPVMTKGMFYHYTTPSTSPPQCVKSGPYTEIIVKEGAATVVKSEEGFSGCTPLRPDNLILVPRDKSFSCDFSSSSSASSADEPKSMISSIKLNSISEIKGENSQKDETCSKSDEKSKESSDVKSNNTDCVVASVCAVTSSPEHLKRQPPPVPQKPPRLRKLSNETRSDNVLVSKELILDKDGLPYLSENLTVEKQKDLAAFLVQDVIERVRSQEVMCSPKPLSSDSSFESTRVERSGSKDDGYSTMSSDIQPEILEKFSDPAPQKAESQSKCEKNESEVSVTSSTVHVKTKDAFTDVMSDHDSAMETSTHSMELHNSNNSLSSQMSSSSCESAVSPVLRVNDMKKFFEEEAKKSKGAKQTDISSRSPVRSPKSPKKHWPFEREKHAKSPISSKPMQIVSSMEITSSAVAGDIPQDDGSVPAADIIFRNFRSVHQDPDHITSLHISEDKLLEDIPEDDEWEAIHNKNIQESIAVQRTSTLLSQTHDSIEPLPKKPQPFTNKLPSSPSSAESSRASLCLRKAKSDSSLSNAGQTKSTSQYEDLTQGTWDSGKVPERSASVSEMDLRPEPSASFSLEDYKRLIVSIDIDETSVLYRVHDLAKDFCHLKMAATQQSDSESDSEAQINFIELLKQKSQRPFTLPTWTPKQTLEELKKTSTPSPVSLKKFDASTPEDWILQFSKEEIDQHLQGTDLHTSSSHAETVVANGETHSAPTGSSISKPDQEESASADRGQDATEEVSAEDSPRSPPSEEQTRFNSNFYSLCNIGSNRSLFSNGSHDQGINKLGPETANVTTAESKEFEEISKQIANLSKTVNDLHRSLSSLNSADSGSNNDLSECPKAVNGASNDLDGYHWVAEEDEFYMASCGGEVIISSNELLHNDPNSWLDDFTLDSGAVSGHCDIQEFYEIQSNGIQFSEDCAFAHSEAEPPVLTSSHRKVFSSLANKTRNQGFQAVHEHEKRSHVLDSMLVSGGESNDSLASDIGLDHMMCQRLIGRRRQARHEVMRYPANARPPLDFSKFFIRFGESEREAVAAFDFLEDLSTSNSESGSLSRLPVPESGLSNGQAQGTNRGHGQGPRSQRSESQKIITTASGRVRRIDRDKRKRRADALKALKREANARAGQQQSPRGESASVHKQDVVDAVNSGNLSLSDSCCEGFSSSSPSFNDLTVL